MDSRTFLDRALFQLTPTRTRCDLVIFAGGVSENLATGLLEPFLSHLKCARDQIQKGGYSITLQPPSTNASWFTKATMQRFVNFVRTPEVLERFVTIESEIIEIENSLQLNEQTVVTTEIEGYDLASDKNLKKSMAFSKSKGGSTGADDALSEGTSKVRLRRVLESRKVVLRKEQAMAYARALVVGFEIDYIHDLLSFSDAFGASRLREACINFMELCKKKNDDHLWMDEVAAMQAYPHSDFSYLGTSGIVLTGEDNIHSQGMMQSGPIDVSASDSTMSQGSVEINPSINNTLPTSAHLQSTDGEAQIPMSWPNHFSYMPNFHGPMFQQMPSYQGYPFPGMQVAPPYYPKKMQWPPNAEGSDLGLNDEPDDNRNRKSSSKKKDNVKSSNRKGSKTLGQHENTSPRDSSSENSSDEYIQRKKNGKPSRKIVIRNINYIKSKGDGDRGSSSDDNSSVENELFSEERHHKTKSRNKRREASMLLSTVNGLNTNENRVANDSQGEKRNEDWDIFQNILMRDTYPRPNDVSTHPLLVEEEYATKKSSEKRMPFGSEDSMAVTEINRSNFGAEDNLRLVNKRDSTYEELLFSHRSKESDNHSLVTISDCAIDSSVNRTEKREDLFNCDQPNKSANERTHGNKFDDNYTSFMGNSTKLENNKRDVLVDDSFMVQSRLTENDPSVSQLKAETFMVSDIVGDVQSKTGPDNLQEKVKAIADFEPDDLYMVLGRKSAVEQVVSSFNPEMDYGTNNAMVEGDKRPLIFEDHIKSKLPSSTEGTNSKASRAPGGKASSKELKSKTLPGFPGKSKSDIALMSKKPFSQSRTINQKSKSEKEEETRKKMEELMIQRQKRIAERSAANGSNSVTSKRNSKKNEAVVGSTKLEKTRLHAPKQEREKLQKPTLRNSTVNRLAASRVTHNVSSTEEKSSQTGKAILKAYKTENEKPGVNKAKTSDKKNTIKNTNGLLSSSHIAQMKKENIDIQPSDGIEDSDNIKELHSLSSIDKDKGNKDSQEDSWAALADDLSIPIDEDSAQLGPLIGEKEVRSKAIPVLEDVKISSAESQFTAKVIVHSFSPSPNKTLNSPASSINENGLANRKLSFSPEISVLNLSTPPPNDGLASKPIHSRKKWNDDNSFKEIKGFRKLLLFGRKSRNSSTN